MYTLTRRRALLAGGGALAGALAGCLGGTGAGPADGSTDGPLSVQASFFVVYDFARNVAGDTVSVENLVPFGQHGHGWEPGPDVQRAVFRSDAFVYAGAGFQPWADDVVRNIHDDGADVAVIEAWADVDLLDADEGDGDAHDDGDHHGDDHGYDGEDDPDPGGDDHDGGGHADDHGEDQGHDDHDETDGHDDHGEGEEHDHGGRDPHFWLDPLRSAQAVETVATGLAEADPDNEGTYRENAATYVDRLEELDRTVEAALEDRTRDVVLFAGHDSFRYLGRRYGFRVESLSGLSPDATPSPRDVRRAQAVVEEHDIVHVLAPVFESDRAARQLVEETGAEEVLPLTTGGSITEEWDERGWGLVEIVEEVNLPSLRTALGAE